jgi:hypothetical protein
MNREQHRTNTLSLEKIVASIKSDNEILAIVNGKYVSRRENDLLLKDSDRAHANLAEKLAVTDKEVATLREHWHGAIAALISKISTQMERK